MKNQGQLPGIVSPPPLFGGIVWKVEVDTNTYMSTACMFEDVGMCPRINHEQMLRFECQQCKESP